MKNFINFSISPHCFDSRILQGEMHTIYQILHLNEETWAKKGQKRWRQLLPKVLLDHSYQLSLCDSPMPHHLAQSYQPLLFLGLVLCYLLSVIGKIRAISILLHLLFTRVTYIQITEVFMALPLKCFFFCSVFWTLLCGEKEDASIWNDMSAELVKYSAVLWSIPTSFCAETSLEPCCGYGKSRLLWLFIASAHGSPLVASLFLLMTY